MTPAIGNVIAACMALAAFAVAVLAGISGGRDAASVLVGAIIAMVACYPIGMMIGLACQRVVADHLTAREQPRRVEESRAPASDQSAQSAAGDEDRRDV